MTQTDNISEKDESIQNTKKNKNKLKIKNKNKNKCCHQQ